MVALVQALLICRRLSWSPTATRFSYLSFGRKTVALDFSCQEISSRSNDRKPDAGVDVGQGDGVEIEALEDDLGGHRRASNVGDDERTVVGCDDVNGLTVVRHRNLGAGNGLALVGMRSNSAQDREGLDDKRLQVDAAVEDDGVELLSGQLDGFVLRLGDDLVVTIWKLEAEFSGFVGTDLDRGIR